MRVLKACTVKNYLEISALAKRGVPALQSWYAMTGLAADEVGFDKCGKVITGNNADLLFWTENVVEDPVLLEKNSILEVVKDGKCYRGTIDAFDQVTFESTIE